MRVKQIVRECDGRIGRLERWARIRLHEEITRDRAAEELGVSASHVGHFAYVQTSRRTPSEYRARHGYGFAGGGVGRLRHPAATAPT